MQPTIEPASQANAAERRLQDLAVHLPVPPEPLGRYTETVQIGSLLFLVKGCRLRGDGQVGRLGGSGSRRGGGPRSSAARHDVPNAEVDVLGAGHFALATAADEIAAFVRAFTR